MLALVNPGFQMKPITLFFAALLAVAGFGTGLVVRPHSTKAPAARESSAAPGKLLPGGTAKPRRVPQTSDSSDKSDKRLTLAEIESALAELKGPSREKLWERVGEIAKGIDPADIPQMLAMLSKLPVEIQNSLRYSLVPRWAEADPRAAMEFANGVKNSNERQQMILGVLRGWAQRDPLAAVAWIQQLPPGRLRNEAPGAVMRALAEKDPEAALALLKTGKADRGFSYGPYSELFDTWAGNDPATAAAKAGELKNPQQRQQAYQNIARRWAEKDVPAALAWAKSLPDSRDRSSALSAVIAAWSATDPKSAAATALALPPRPVAR